MEKIFFCLTVFCFIMMASGCDNPALGNTEQLEVSLPQWPPAASIENPYPELSRWYVQVCGPKNYGFYCSEDQLSFTMDVDISQLYSVTVTPLTLDVNGNETVFFNPAGMIYPSKKSELTWEQGYSAKVLERCFLSTSAESDNIHYIKCFNWNKFSELVCSKIDSGKEGDGSSMDIKLYNPWHKNPSELADLICKRKFSASSINNSRDVTRSISEIPVEAGRLLSSFIPENEIIQTYEKFCLNQDEINLYSLYNEYCLIIQIQKSEKLSASVVNLPIYIE